MQIGDRRELFVDDALISALTGGARLRLHHPVPQELALVHDADWEGSGSGYHSIFRDGDRYRMYYKAWHLDVQPGKLHTGRHPLYCCYAESDGGIQWTKPELGLVAHKGSTANNIVLNSGPMHGLNVDAGHPAVFLDENPDAPADARYKAIVRSSKPNGLIPLKSPDGFQWSPMTDKPILSGIGAFDSQNLAFWDPTIGKYRAYWRIFTAGVTTTEQWKPAGIRAIRTATSDDLIHWAPHHDLTYVDSPPEQLYTNQVKPYHRAPHLLIGLPTRYVERPWSEAMRNLPERKHREMRSSSVERYGTAITEALLMASRDGVQFKRWNEALLRPGPERPGTWNYGHQYVGWHIVETKSSLPGAPNELSLYAGESYWTEPGSALRRYTLRLDGFVSASAPRAGGTLVTRPVVFNGSRLSLNFATAAAGRIRVGIERRDGSAVEGRGLDDCHNLFGDTVERTVVWKDGSDVSSIAGQPVRLRFELSDADLYSYRFETA
ncbi:MAG: hypothetical protein ACF8TS_08550 [Maioricimonas sp. JB049]